MNDDHQKDSLIIAKANGFPAATTAKMTDIDGSAGVWQVTDSAGTHELRIPWAGGEITERPQIREEIVKISTAAQQRFGITPAEKAQGSGSHEHDGGNPHQHNSGGSHPHGDNPHGDNPHKNPHPLCTADSETGEKPFSVVVRESSWAHHSESEGADFMTDIMRGISPLSDYTALVVQHYVLYKELEKASDKLAENPLTAGFDTPALRRIKALEIDLQHLLGANWEAHCKALPASSAYAARIREIAANGWHAGIVAHHYTRYLGDLSGGQMIAKRIRSQHGLESNGVAFYEFAELGDLNEFKQQYRAQLDRLGSELNSQERKKFLQEVGIAYDFNTEVFNQLAAQKANA
ncbi:biliverdin-producing heme oxygenase [Canibacter sp. lx-72]|nr:biliverdin-producing heme oxygenase [Canibacter zhuwentaonis]MBT1018622.1 biliverdin-producing heme oxygenase [Canibacter zhuwentaonis]MBT1035868.1 biliverdin-producing heme oxygenase [Canibacter zhuwentaonis]